MEEGFCAAQCGKNVVRDYFSDPIWKDQKVKKQQIKSFFQGQLLKNNVPYVCHYNPRLVKFFPTFLKFIYVPLALCMVSIQERFLIKSRL